MVKYRIWVFLNYCSWKENRGPGCPAVPSEFPQVTDGPGMCRSDICSPFSNSAGPSEEPRSLNQFLLPYRCHKSFKGRSWILIEVLPEFIMVWSSFAFWQLNWLVTSLLNLPVLPMMVEPTQFAVKTLKFYIKGNEQVLPHWKNVFQILDTCSESAGIKTYLFR